MGKMHEILDNNIHLNINKDSTNKMIIEIRVFLIRRKNRKYIDKFIYKKLYVSGWNYRNLMGFWRYTKKVIRWDDSCISSPHYSFVTYLKEIIEKSLKKKLVISKSYKIVNKLIGMSLNSYHNYKLVSSDVVSMYS